VVSPKIWHVVTSFQLCFLLSNTLAIQNLFYSWGIKLILFKRILAKNPK
jgi:hypothetical protein